MKHLVFYDSSCGFCNRCVAHLARLDKKRQFYFASLDGELAKAAMIDRAQPHWALVLVENYFDESRKFHGGAKAVLRICQMLGGRYAILGLFFYLPEWMLNPIYRLVARYRLRYGPYPKVPGDERFLP
jgi:predicted DCC family thiol-disulfide oxidoreductase YuxK